MNTEKQLELATQKLGKAHEEIRVALKDWLKAEYCLEKARQAHIAASNEVSHITYAMYKESQK